MSSKAKKILIVDDEASVCSSIKESLKRLGHYKVLVAKSGKMGTWFVSKPWQRPDLIILDLMMPFVDGFEVLKRIRQDNNTKDIPVIVLTGRSDQEAQEKVKSFGCEDYIIKPVELKVILDRIDQVLKRQSITCLKH